MDQSVLQAAARVVGRAGWESVEPLTGGRAGLARVSDGRRTFVVKAYPSGGPGAAGARERAALAALAGAAGVPALVGECDDPPLAVMSALDGTRSLADALLGRDRAEATEMIESWACALAELHGAGTSERRRSFAEQLRRRDRDLSAHALSRDFAEAAQKYAEALPALGLRVDRDALDALRALPAALHDPAAEVLSPGDTCPDNNLVVDGRVHLLDLEFAELRHAAWDVAYLRTPWPSCWCAWRLPDDVAESAVATYRRARGAWAGADRFTEDLDLATLGWCAMTPAWFLQGALETRLSGSDPRRPTRRSFVLHRLSLAARLPGPERLTRMMAELHTVLVGRWGAAPLALAPAFRQTDC